MPGSITETGALYSPTVRDFKLLSYFSKINGRLGSQRVKDWRLMDGWMGGFEGWMKSRKVGNLEKVGNDNILILATHFPPSLI